MRRNIGECGKGDVTLFYCLNLCLKCFPAFGAAELESRIGFSGEGSLSPSGSTQDTLREFLSHLDLS